MRLVSAVALLAALNGAASASDEIVVTAERRASKAGEQAASIAIIDNKAIERIGADHPSELLARAPGALIHRGNGVEQLTAIRSPVLTGGAGAGSFLFLQDGVPLRSAGFGNVNALFEAHTEIADRIEVIRGPSGALYGANAIHGVVNVLTPSPSRPVTASLSVSGDTVERFKGSASASGSSGAHGLYGAVSLLSEHGYRADSGVDDQKATLRHELTSQAFSIKTIFSFVNLNQETAGFVVGPDAYEDKALRRGNLNPEAFRDARAYRLSSEFSFSAGEGVEVAVTPFLRKTDTSFLLHFFPSKALEENGHWSVGAQSAVYVDPDEDVSVIAGLDWEYTEGYLREIQSLPSFGTFPRGVHYDFEVRAASVSGFAQARAEIASRLSATAALRVDWTRYVYDNKTGAGAFGRFLRPADRTDEYLTASPKASLLYALDEGAVYLSYARGARPPQVQDLYRLTNNQMTDPALPETIDSVELGWRGAAGPRIAFDFALYAMSKRNVFFRDADGFNVNDGKTRHIGIEADIRASLPGGWSLDVDASYAAHTYRFDRPVLSASQFSETIRKGDDIDTAPRILAGARLSWAPDDAPLSAEIEWERTGRYYADAANTRAYPGHDIVNLRTGWRVRRGLALSLTVRNLFDDLYAERADLAFNEDRYFPGEPRTLALGLSAKL
jgi:outer membrane receptor protein involved in Fe transport